jgi:catechol 2,3-dioxygenase-like lactoylglutathione lyase family enzyme
MQLQSSFSGFSVRDMTAAKEFYADTLGLKIEELPGMGIHLQLPGGLVFVYAKDDHQPATYTCLNFVVADIDAAIEELSGKGVLFEHYHNDDLPN